MGIIDILPALLFVAMTKPMAKKVLRPGGAAIAFTVMMLIGYGAISMLMEGGFLMFLESALVAGLVAHQLYRYIDQAPSTGAEIGATAGGAALVTLLIWGWSQVHARIFG